MLLAAVPAGFLLLAGVAALQAGRWDTPSTLFAALAALAFVAGVLLTPAGPASAPSPPDLRRFARGWLRAHPSAAEADVRAALARRFRGTRPVDAADFEAATALPQPEGPPGWGCLAALLTGPALAVRHRFFPAAPARPADIEAVLAELRAEGALGPGGDSAGPA
jgi:hypothetical protein